MTLRKNDSVFISRMQVHKNTSENLQRIVDLGAEYEPNMQGYWIKRGSPAHSMAILLGYEFYRSVSEIMREFPDGSYDRNGRIR